LRTFSQISFGGFLLPFLRSIFDPFFGLRVFSKLLVLRDFLKLYGGFGPVFGPLLDRSFHHDFHLPREGVFHVLVFMLGLLKVLHVSGALASDRSSTSTGAVNCYSQLTLLVFGPFFCRFHRLATLIPGWFRGILLLGGLHL
jgi:hypothetical protein